MERRLQIFRSSMPCSGPNCRRRTEYIATAANGANLHHCKEHALRFALKYNIVHPGVKYVQKKYEYLTLIVSSQEDLGVRLTQASKDGLEVVSVQLLYNMNWAGKKGVDITHIVYRKVL